MRVIDREDAMSEPQATAPKLLATDREGWGPELGGDNRDFSRLHKRRRVGLIVIIVDYFGVAPTPGRRVPVNRHTNHYERGGAFDDGGRHQAPKERTE